jgi:hypothetical protein
MNFHNLVDDLEAIGFFSPVSPSDAASVKQEILKYKWLFPAEGARSFLADAEDLAEQGALNFIAELAPRLAQHGVHLPVIVVPRKGVKVRDPHSGEIKEIIKTALRMDDSIPDTSEIIYLRPARETAPESGGYYRITIDSLTQELWNAEMDMDKMWESSMCHTLILVNKLLEDAHATERMYGLYGGNDGQAAFLTPDQFALIQNCTEIQERDKPWKPYEVK